jgi:hypothetical protein
MTLYCCDGSLCECVEFYYHVGTGRWLQTSKSSIAHDLLHSCMEHLHGNNDSFNAMGGGCHES